MEMKDVALPLYQAKGWIRFLGVMMIIVGALYAVTIIGLLFAWLPIWLGVLLFQASSRIEYAYEGGGAVSFMESLQKLKTYFIINGVVVLNLVDLRWRRGIGRDTRRPGRLYVLARIFHQVACGHDATG